MSPKAASLAAKKGYKAKVFLAGFPAWKKAKNPVYANAKHISKSLGNSVVIVDVRSNSEIKKSHIKGAVAISLAQLNKLDKKYKAKVKGKRLHSNYKKLLTLADKKAPIVLVGNKDSDKNAKAAYRVISGWKFKKLAILEGGFESWSKKGMPTAQGAAASKISYVKKKVPGAVDVADFAKAVNSGTVILDVRETSEVKKGAIKGSKHFALGGLDKSWSNLNKNKKTIAHCSTGVRAEIAYKLLKKKGFKKVYFLNETITVKPDGGYKIE